MVVTNSEVGMPVTPINGWSQNTMRENFATLPKTILLQNVKQHSIHTKSTFSL